MKAYVFRGPPASGKGTITKEFIKLIAGKVAFLELDNFRWGFHLYNREVKDVGEEEHRLSYENFLSVLGNYCKNGSYNLVLEGLFSWENYGPHGNMNEITEILKKYGFDFKVFYLKADFETLWERNTKRKYVVPEDEFKDLYDYVGKENPKREIVLDVGKLPRPETLEVLNKYL